MITDIPEAARERLAHLCSRRVNLGRASYELQNRRIELEAQLDQHRQRALRLVQRCNEAESKADGVTRIAAILQPGSATRDWPQEKQWIVDFPKTLQAEMSEATATISLKQNELQKLAQTRESVAAALAGTGSLLDRMQPLIPGLQNLRQEIDKTISTGELRAVVGASNEAYSQIAVMQSKIEGLQQKRDLLLDAPLAPDDATSRIRSLLDRSGAPNLNPAATSRGIFFAESNSLSSIVRRDPHSLGLPHLSWKTLDQVLGALGFDLAKTLAELAIAEHGGKPVEQTTFAGELDELEEQIDELHVQEENLILEMELESGLDVLRRRSVADYAGVIAKRVYLNSEDAVEAA